MISYEEFVKMVEADLTPETFDFYKEEWGAESPEGKSFIGTEYNNYKTGFKDLDTAINHAASCISMQF